MTEEKTTCSTCGREILKRTAERRNGMCAPCQRDSQKSPDELFAEAVFARIEEVTEPFSSYKNALNALASLPRGYTLCFAFHYVNADIWNGGISQLHGNSTWTMIPDAVEAAEAADNHRVASLLREVIYYYHQKNRSKLKRRITDDYFKSIPSGWQKTLAMLDDEYFAMEDQANAVISDLCSHKRSLFE
ncbi:MAG: DUF4375 domain-containing protein [Planctomycetaceae bacterium]|nr:DUF4375 domain-containing protein [Planctomycetaceae bacterium]